MRHQEELIMLYKAKGMVVGSFTGDSLALGAHLIFSTERIVRQFGRIEGLIQPHKNSYHKTKCKGEFTNCGDQAFVLLESLASCRVFDINDFSSRWKDSFFEYKGYVDQAMRGTLQNLALEKSPLETGSTVNDFSGAARIAPLVYFMRNDLDALVDASRLQTAMTHGNALTIEVSEFFSRVCFQILNGSTPTNAIWEITGEHFTDTRISTWVKEGYASREKDSIEAIMAFGQNGSVQETFPGVIHLIMKYEQDIREAMIQAVMAGGESASRAMIVGMVLGCSLGMDGIPGQWVDDLKKGKEIIDLLDQIG
ncbi:ADP-ribosylglycohydrolase family protein [bacterium]|nr:ADP-ribosylglycohydrolase family protein [bacterium]